MAIREPVRECLEKDPADRTPEDIDILLEFTQTFPAFFNMTLATRRALCAGKETQLITSLQNVSHTRFIRLTNLGLSSFQ